MIFMLLITTVLSILLDITHYRTVTGQLHLHSSPSHYRVIIISDWKQNLCGMARGSADIASYNIMLPAKPHLCII